MQKRVSQINSGINGTVTIPSDKSISHRAVIFSSLAKGNCVIKNFSKGADCHSSLNLFKNLGVEIEFLDEQTLSVKSKGILAAPKKTLDCGNSGTTMRLVSGILAGQNFDSVMIGDESLSKRPMKRVIEPLELMGAKILSNDYKAPLLIKGHKLNGIDYVSPLASAQVKSCILLAGLKASGTTTVTEPYLSRNHTEIMLKYLGADIKTENTKVSLQPSKLVAKDIEISGDISSAAFFIVAGLIVPNSKILLRNVGLNPTRTGIIDVVKMMGGNIEIIDEREVAGESVGDVKVEYSELKGCEIKGEIIPRLIDELPVIAILATQAEGKTTIHDAQDLRNKESDRIKAIVCELKKLGAETKELPDGFEIKGTTSLNGGCEVETYHDHRLAMSLYVAGLICNKPILINGFEWVNISFPEFEELFNVLL